MKKCCSCNQDISENTRYCAYCGAKQANVSSLAFILSIIAAVLVCFGINLYVNILIIVISVISYLILYINKSQCNKKFTKGLNLFAIIGSIIWIIFIIL